MIVARALDAEQKSHYNLTVDATDGTRSVSTQVIELLMKCLWKHCALTIESWAPFCDRCEGQEKLEDLCLYVCCVLLYVLSIAGFLCLY